MKNGVANRGEEDVLFLIFYANVSTTSVIASLCATCHAFLKCQDEHQTRRRLTFQTIVARECDGDKPCARPGWPVCSRREYGKAGR